MSYTRPLLSRLVVAAVLVAVAAAVLVAAPGEAAHASSEWQDAGADQVRVLPQQGRPPESNLPFLFAVYLITWAAFFGYVFYMSRRQREMQREIAALKQALAERDRRVAEAEKSGANRTT